MSKQPSILVCNDDGVTAPGIKALIEVAREFGRVTVVAPDKPQSGMGHAISIGRPLRLSRQYIDGHVEVWACSGTPADCVKLATGVLLRQKPDLLISGINHGSNSSISILYSGTMSAAMEGTIEDIPSVGFSLLNYSMEADFAGAQHAARVVIAQVLQHGLPQGVALNVNIPNLPPAALKGLKVTRQSVGRFVEEFDKRIDPYGRDYYWLTGKFFTQDNGEDTDEWALAQGYVSICPAQIDLTAHHAMSRINQWNLKFEGATAADDSRAD